MLNMHIFIVFVTVVVGILGTYFTASNSPEQKAVEVMAHDLLKEETGIDFDFKTFEDKS